MKKLILCLFLVSAAVFTSCDKDDESDVPTTIDASLIVGEWSLASLSIDDGELSSTINGLPVTGTYTAIGENLNHTVNFSDSEDPKTFTSSGGYTAVVTASVLAQTFTEELPITDFLGAGAWRIEGNKLFLNNNGIEEGSEITALTAQSMSLKVNFEETVDLQGNMTDATGTLNVTLTKN